MKQIIKGILATHGIGESTYPIEKGVTLSGHLLRDGKILVYAVDYEPGDWVIHDVRHLMDSHNPPFKYMEEIYTLNNMMISVRRCSGIVVCCGAGISRSNAIALGYLVYKGMDFYEAQKLVEEKVPQAQIEPAHLKALRFLFDVK